MNEKAGYRLDLEIVMIRPVIDRDTKAIAGIYNYFIKHTAVSYEEKPLSTREMAARIKRVTQAGYPWFVVETGNEVTGYCYACQWNPRAAYRHTVEITVYVRHDMTGQGLGTQLYQALFAELKQMQVRTVIGGISLPNPASVALHTRVGMKKVAHFENVGYKFGQWLDVGYWQGELDKLSQE